MQHRLLVRSLALLANALVALTLCAHAQEASTLAAPLEPLRPLLEKTWRGSFKMGSSDKPLVDVARWERALNGQAVRILHSLNDGMYGGETIFRWDAAQKQITYHYFTTAGFMTIGTLRVENGKFITHEVVNGSAGGVTEVRGTSELLPNGSLQVTNEHLVGGTWRIAREANYQVAPDAKLVFR